MKDLLLITRLRSLLKCFKSTVSFFDERITEFANGEHRFSIVKLNLGQFGSIYFTRAVEY